MTPPLSIVCRAEPKRSSSPAARDRRALAARVSAIPRLAPPVILRLAPFGTARLVPFVTPRLAPSDTAQFVPFVSPRLDRGVQWHWYLPFERDTAVKPRYDEVGGQAAV